MKPYHTLSSCQCSTGVEPCTLARLELPWNGSTHICVHTHTDENTRAFVRKEGASQACGPRPGPYPLTDCFRPYRKGLPVHLPSPGTAGKHVNKQVRALLPPPRESNKPSPAAAGKPSDLSKQRNPRHWQSVHMGPQGQTCDSSRNRRKEAKC